MAVAVAAVLCISCKGLGVIYLTCTAGVVRAQNKVISCCLPHDGGRFFPVFFLSFFWTGWRQAQYIMTIEGYLEYQDNVGECAEVKCLTSVL